MGKRALIISGSPRRGGNSDLLCDEFMRGSQESGAQVEKIFLRDKKIGYCSGCYYCQSHNGVCAIRDDMTEILEKIAEADVLALASPVYFYSVDAQIKTFIDRCLARWTSIKNKEFYYIMTSAEDSPSVMDCTLECFRGLAKCLEGSKEMGVIYGKGVHEAGEIKGAPAMTQAYQMGKNI